MSRADKLKKLADNKNAGSGMIVLTDGEKFINAFQAKIEQFQKALSVGVEVDAYDLIEELKGIKAFVPAIKELVDALDGVEIPPVPETIEVKGLAEVTERFEKQLILLEKISNIKLPEVDVKVESISKDNADLITKNVKELVKTNKNVGLLNKEVMELVTAKLENVIDTIQENAPKEQSQEVDEYVPVRRVKLVGSKLVFDDDAWSGGGNSGGGIPPGLTRADSTALAIVNPDGSGVDNSSNIFDGETAVTPKFAVISASSSGDNTIVAAVPGKKIRVLSYAFVSSGTVNAKWQSEATDISGLMYFIANTGISSGYNPKGHFQTVSGKALELNLSGAQAVGGHLNYIEVD